MDANSKPASAPPELDAPAAATRLGGVGRERELARLEALFEQVSSVLVDVARPRPVCVLVHDLHLADGATRGLVAHLAQTRFGAPELDGVGSERLWGLLALTSRDLDDSWLAGAAGERVAL